MVGRRTYDMVVGKWKTVRPVVVRFCGVYDSPKFKEITFPNFNQGSEGSSKRRKSSSSSSFNTESEDANINLNTTVVDEGCKIKRMEVECREREVEATEYRAQQEDISQNRRDLPRDIPLVSVEVHSRHGPSDAMHNPPQPLKVSQKTLVSFLMEITLISIDFLTPSNPDGRSYWIKTNQDSKPHAHT
ncbi:hypothetical protein Tco_1070917 [Tanacetum coccineum]|uniref:Uncharacterized protein n=1 Tax=Tanacetum coccineum TaxID=301880 RepID=A0ABQ5HN20_9ASTR